MIKDIDLTLTPQEAFEERTIKKKAASKCGLPFTKVTGVKILRKSIDARRIEIKINLRVRLFVVEVAGGLGQFAAWKQVRLFQYFIELVVVGVTKDVSKFLNVGCKLLGISLKLSDTLLQDWPCLSEVFYTKFCVIAP